MKLIVKSLLIVLLLIGFGKAEAQITEKPLFGKIAITGGTVHTVTNGTIENGVILINGNKIAFVGKNAKITSDYKVVDASGKHVYPGFMDSGTSLGLVEINAVAVTVDNQEIGEFKPNMLAFTAFNPHSAAIPVTRVNGITHVLTAPQGGRIAGQAAVMNLWGYSPDSMAVDGSAGMVVEWPSQRRFGRWDSRSDKEVKERYEKAITALDEMLDKARFYDAMMSAFEDSPKGKEQPDKDIELEAMREMVNGETPLLIQVSREKDILSALEWASKDENSDLKIIFAGVEEGWRVADKIAEAGIPCLVSSLHLPTRQYDHVHKPYQNASLLTEAGVKVAIMTGEVENVRNLPFHAGYAAAYGLGTEEAVKAVTINPAEIFGFDDVLGSLEAGKMANLFISDGDPFEPLTHVEHVFINGYKIPMTDRHSQLYEEFLDRDAVEK